MGDVGIFAGANNGTGWFGNGTFPPLDCSVPEPDPLCYDPNSMYEPPPFKLTWGKILSSIGMALLIVISLGGNILVCTAFFYYRRLRTVTNYFVVSLAVSDLVVGALSMPLWLSYECTEWRNLPSWVDYLALSRFLELIDVLSAVSSIANLTAISIDRFFSIMSPLHHRTRMTPRAAIIMLTLAWVYALAISLCRLIPNFEDKFVAFTASMGFFVPLLIILGSYAGIYAKVSSKRSSLSRSIEKEWNIATTLFIVIFLFVICWMPFFLLSLLYKYCKSCTFEHDVLLHLISLVKWMHYLNSGCNPFIYGFFNVNFKQAFKALFKKCCGRLGNDSDFSAPYDEESVSFIRRPYNNIKRRLERRRRSQGSARGVSDFEHSYTTLTGYFSDRKSGMKNGDDKRRQSSLRSPGRNSSFRGKHEHTNGHTNGHTRNGFLSPNTYVDLRPVIEHHQNGSLHEKSKTDHSSSGQKPCYDKYTTTLQSSETGVEPLPFVQIQNTESETPTVEFESISFPVPCINGADEQPPSYEEIIEKPTDKHVPSELKIFDNELLNNARESCV